MEARHDLGELIEIAAGAAGVVVDEPALVEPAHDLLLVGQRQSPRIGFAPRDGHADDEVVASHLPDAAGNLDGEPQPVLERAAPPVGAFVGQWRPELVDEAVVSREEIDAVESRVAVAARGFDEGCDQFLDLGLGHGVAAPGIVEGGNTGWRPVGLPAVVLVAMPADMIDLMDHDCAMRMAFIGDLAEMRDDHVAFMQEIPARQDAGPVGWRGLDHDHRRTAARPFPVVAEMARTRDALVTHVGRMGSEDDPVLQRLVAQLQGREERWKGF